MCIYIYIFFQVVSAKVVVPAACSAYRLRLGCCLPEASWGAFPDHADCNWDQVAAGAGIVDAE